MNAVQRGDRHLGRLLAECPPGATVVLQDIEAGHRLRARIAALGLVPGVRLHVLRQHGRGPVLIALHGSRLALGRGIAERMTVRTPA